MHKHLGLFVTGICLFVLFVVPGLLDRVFAFLLVGQIPFTGYSLPPFVMFIAYAFLLIFAVYAVTTHLETMADPAKRETKSRERARKQVLKNTTRQTHTSTSVRPKKHYQAAATDH